MTLLSSNHNARRRSEEHEPEQIADDVSAVIDITDLKSLIRGNERERTETLARLLGIEGTTREGIAHALGMLPDLIRLSYRNSRKGCALLRELKMFPSERIRAAQEWVLRAQVRADVHALVTQPQRERPQQQTLFDTRTDYHDLGY
ncbi:hypothetical protein COU80_06150 [Candidatus Peregrinibacteria bacterium CG10_big_fil_rev_8_21_14_0_10_55_24]|nr:MAG: hypothetical protein COU80_06150 [Candidatus Peregrinibacteria bacterium CG10_big_fil_rev_8_21_14_0_10_55_24]